MCACDSTYDEVAIKSTFNLKTTTNQSIFLIYVYDFMLITILVLYKRITLEYIYVAREVTCIFLTTLVFFFLAKINNTI